MVFAGHGRNTPIPDVGSVGPAKFASAKSRSCRKGSRPLTRARNGGQAKPHVVIVGGGFGGLYAATGYAAGGASDVVDHRNHRLFQPLLYQVAMAGLSPGDVAYPIRSILHRRDTRVVPRQGHGRSTSRSAPYRIKNAAATLRSSISPRASATPTSATKSGNPQRRD